jgi:hypothetical protein
VSDLNVDFAGAHLFSGTRTDTAPVLLDPAFAGFGGPDDTYYQGDAVTLSVRADAGREVVYGMTADRAGFEELIGALPKVADYRSELGAGQAALERINLGHDDAEVYLERQISDIENVDLTEATTPEPGPDGDRERDGDDRAPEPGHPRRLPELSAFPPVSFWSHR